MLPFDITLAFTNEYGSAAACKIYAVELLNEGYGISIDDAVSEMQATFVARGISPLQAAGQVAALSCGRFHHGTRTQRKVSFCLASHGTCRWISSEAGHPP